METFLVSEPFLPTSNDVMIVYGRIVLASLLGGRLEGKRQNLEPLQ